jgi:hypothetical protein
LKNAPCHIDRKHFWPADRLFTKSFDLILWSCNDTSRFPSQHRFVLAERLERNLYDLLETRIWAVVAWLAVGRCTARRCLSVGLQPNGK